MLTQLQNSSNGTTVLPARQDSKPLTPSVAPAHPVANPNPIAPTVNQVPPNSMPINSTRSSSPAAIRTNSSQPVPNPNSHPPSVPSVAAPAVALGLPSTTTRASFPSVNTNSTVSSTNGSARNMPTFQSNTPDPYSGVIISSEPHISTGVLVAIGLSGIIIALMFMILIRLLIKCQHKKKLKEQSDDGSLIVIPSTAFLDHPKNQEMGGVGASPSPMINRSSSNSSMSSNMAFKKPQEQYPLNNSDPFQQMEFLHPMGTPFTLPQAWDGSRPTLGNNRLYF